MGWGNCGTDSQGRPIGYVHEATCDYPGCTEKIDRGLSYACGDMHGETEYGCEKYFCVNHRNNYVVPDDDRAVCVCDSCAQIILATGDWREDEDGEIVPNSK